MMWQEWEAMADDVTRERAAMVYDECPVCLGAGVVPGAYDERNQYDCYWCAGHGYVPTSDAEMFERQLAEGLGL